MSNAKAVSVPNAAAAKKRERKESELGHAVRLMGQFLVGQRRHFVMALLMLIIEAASNTCVPLVLGYLITYLTRRMGFLAQAQGATAPLSPLQEIGLSTLIDPDIDTVLIVAISIVLLTLLNSVTDSLAEIFRRTAGGCSATTCVLGSTRICRSCRWPSTASSAPATCSRASPAMSSRSRSS